MALINCPECNQQVSSQAKTCPKCGCPISAPVSTGNSSTEMPFVWRIVIGIILIGIAVIWMVSDAIR